MSSYTAQNPGPGYRELIQRSWSISWPMVLIMAFEFLISLTDVYIAGLLGKEYQGAVGFSTQMYFIFIVVANALTVGTVATVARIFSGSTKEELSNSVFTILTSVAVSGFILGTFGVVMSSPIVSLLNIPDAVKRNAIPLIEIYAAGVVFHYFLINSNGILRATGGIRRSLITMAVVCVSNVGLNFLFVFHTPLGFRGIALSTVAGLAIGAIINWFHLRPMAGVSRVFRREFLKKVAAIGWPSGVQQVSWQVGSTVMFLILSALPLHRVEIIAAFTNGLRIESAIFLPAFALNMANAVVTGNLLGEGRKEEAFRAGMVTAGLGVLLITVLTAVVVLNARLLASFLSNDQIVIQECVRYIYISMISEPFMAWAVILGGALNGAGDTRGVMVIIILSFWIVRIPAAFLFGVVLFFGAPAMWWAMNASIFTHAVFLSRRYFRRKWLELQ
ncbi:MAG TPA: MATE family efflux transporter [Spirochaetota bacterium]|nr:MATE family efflux transporter [Spirochaetota bacterium]HPQ54229.1 MATE family efflux transporter [Spirochaetota bacterium]